MRSMRKKIDAAVKAKVAVEAIRGAKTVSEIAGQYDVHPNQVAVWRKAVLEAIPDVFSRRQAKETAAGEELVSELYRQIGQLKVEVDWLKKKAAQLHGG